LFSPSTGSILPVPTYDSFVVVSLDTSAITFFPTDK
jgi:hypothetical protein